MIQSLAHGGYEYSSLFQKVWHNFQGGFGFGFEGGLVGLFVGWFFVLFFLFFLGGGC